MTYALASSTIKGFDLQTTVVEAENFGFSAVQLFVNNQLEDPSYFKSLVTIINNSQIKDLVFHLPNIASINPSHIRLTDKLINELNPDISVVALIHYEDEITLPDGTKRAFENSDIPKLNHATVCLENSKAGVFDIQHVNRAISKCRELNIPFVFDFGRIMYANSRYKINESIYIAHIKGVIENLIPGWDIIHCSSKKQWGDFRTYACAVGDEGDITIPLIPHIRAFSQQGGIVVFEHEKLDQAVRSKMNLEA